MELHHPLIRVPFERSNQLFRLFQKQLVKEMTRIHQRLDQVAAEQKPAQNADVDQLVQQLDAVANAILQLKELTKQQAADQRRQLETCIVRTQFLKELSTAKSKENETLVHSRLVGDFMLCNGFLESAQYVQSHKDGLCIAKLDLLLDQEVHTECHRIVKDLMAHNLSTAVDWCKQNASRLRRLQSNIEFRLRLQEVIELVRSRKRVEAIQYAQSFLTPFVMQLEDPKVKSAAIGEVQEVMASLAFETPEECGVEAYTKLFSMARWLQLRREFESAHRQVYCIHDPTTLLVVLHAGLSSLNTRTCRQIRESRAKHRSSEIREDQEDEEMDDNSEENESKRHKVHAAGYEKKLPRSNSCNSLDNSPSRRDAIKTAKQARREKRHTSTNTVPLASTLCPTCGEAGGKLSSGLPFARHPHSRLLCRVTQTVMDEHNPPVVLPNGYVYSQKAIDEMLKSRNGLIKCIETQETFALEEVRPVYII